MKSIGERLQRAREEKGLTINEVSVATKINPKVLVALEDGDLSRLPPKSFLRGFVRTYSMYLRLNTDEILNQFTQELGKTVYTAPVQPVAAPATQEKPNEAERPPTAESEVKTSDAPDLTALLSRIVTHPRFRIGFGLTALVVILVVALSFIGDVVEKYEREATVEPQLVEPQLVEPQLVQNPTAAAPAPGALASGEPTQTGRASESVASPSAAPERPAPQKAAVENAPTPTPPATPQVVSRPAAPTTTTQPSPAPAPAPNRPPGATQTVLIEALDRVSLVVRVNDGPVQRLQLAPDQVHTIRGQGDVFVDVSDGGAVNIIHNGREKGVPGDLGKPIKIKFP